MAAAVEVEAVAEDRAVEVVAAEVAEVVAVAAEEADIMTTPFSRGALHRDSSPETALGIGWRDAIALTIDRRADVSFVEIVAEHFPPSRPLPAARTTLRDRGCKIIPHGHSLSLGGAERPDPRRVDALANIAACVGAPFVSEHIAFVRAGEVEAGHLLPIPRTRAALDVLVENVLEAKKRLPVPLALENVSTLIQWPGAEMDEATFVREALERTDCLMLFDVANFWANAKNFSPGSDAVGDLKKLPLERLAYVHVGGGVERDGVYHDTHAHETPAGIIALLGELCAIANPPGVMLERDDNYPPPEQLNRELDAIAGAISAGSRRRQSSKSAAHAR
jgi:uncharacterized protein (UPF0276 family)